jgi:hypothetical protein
MKTELIKTLARLIPRYTHAAVQSRWPDPRKSKNAMMMNMIKICIPRITIPLITSDFGLASGALSPVSIRV